MSEPSLGMIDCGGQEAAATHSLPARNEWGESRREEHPQEHLLSPALSSIQWRRGGNQKVAHHFQSHESRCVGGGVETGGRAAGSFRQTCHSRWRSLSWVASTIP